MKNPTFRLRSLAVFAGLGLAALGLSGCSSSGSGSDAGPVKITFWHSASGAAGDSLNQQIAAFNEAQAGKIQVAAVYQGNYESSMAKLANAVQSGGTPALMQASDVFTGYMIDSKLTVSATDLAAKDGAYDFADLAPAVKNYYTVDGQVRSMPYQISQPVLVLNPEVLAKAGLSPADVPTDITGLLDTASKIKQVSGIAGLSFFVNTWWNEQFAAAQGLTYCTPDNGVSGQNATALTYTDPKQLAVWSKLQQLVKEGAMVNTGADATAAVGAFTSGGAAMALVSSGAIGNIVKTGVNFAVKAFPVSAAEGGVVPGGNSLWVIGKDRSAAEQKAAWELSRYLGSTDVQTKNFLDSGYLPTTLTAAKAIASATPQQQALLDQLATSKSSTATAGCHSGALGEVRQSLQPALESLLAGGDVRAVFEDQENKAKDIIERYRKRAGQ
ncbi:MAG: extracellular solute-binding protein [Renibacterium sp.]|nr:extracellular solute-binding protein [Renibacterium sp.]